MPVHRLTPERVFSQIERIVQSRKKFTLDETVRVNITHVELPASRTKKKFQEGTGFFKNTHPF